MAKQKDSDAVLLRQCSWCRAVFDPESGEWVPFPEVLGGATHGMCPQCAEELYAKHGMKPGKNPVSQLIGNTIIEVRPATAAEKKMFYWHESFMVVVLAGGIKLIASSDEELNAPGVLNYVDGKGNLYTLAPATRR